jgi:hypothetical protein
MNRLFLAAVLLASVATPAAAGTIITTDFSANGSGLTSLPGDDLAVATSIDVSNWTASSVPVSLGGLAPGDAVDLTNPILTALGSSITISWDAGAFSDTIKTTGVSFVGDTLDIVGKGTLTGPGVPVTNFGTLDLAFTQAGGTGEAISGSGTFVDTTTVPEPSTWALLALGFGFLLWVGGKHGAKSQLRSADHFAA